MTVTKNMQLRNELQALLKANPDMTYDEGGSESSGERIEVVRLPWYRVMRWKQEVDNVAEVRLYRNIENHEYSFFYVTLHELLTAHKLISIVRKTKKDGVSDLYILCYFGWWYVGIKTTLITT